MADKNKTNALAVVDPEYTALALPAEEVEALINKNLMGEGLDVFDIDRIKIPSGGILQWAVPTIEGETEMVKELEGVIIYQKMVRTYWLKSFDDGGATAPDCKSDDNHVGIGNPGGYCRECPLAKFGSALDKKGNPAKGQACKLMMLVFILGDDGFLPRIIVLPPTSIAPMRKYLVRLTERAILASTVVTKLELEKDKNDAGIEYSKAKPSIVGKLSEEKATQLKLFIANLSVMFDSEGVKDDDIGTPREPTATEDSEE